METILKDFTLRWGVGSDPPHALYQEVMGEQWVKCCQIKVNK